MRLIYGILHHRKAVILGFALFTALCVACMPLVHVNFDLTSYLPKETRSTESLNLMREAYGTGIPNARLYAEGLPLPEASKLADDLRRIDGVKDVLWLGSQADVLQPLEMLDQGTVASWMSDKGFLYRLTIDSGKAAGALVEARAAALAHNATGVALSGEAVNSDSAQKSASAEVAYILLMALVIIVVIVSLTSASWFEWVVFLLVLAMAIAMNMGTNIFKGEISFITQICAAVLQLAVSMDYAVVMLHTFRRNQQRYPEDPVRAMAHAMRQGFSVVLSSAAVTFFGFLSLCIMSFLIGADMGIVLAKGIFFSFVSVMFLMPCIILACLKPLQRFEHRSLLPSFERFGAWCTRLMIPLSVIICIVVVPAYLAQHRIDFTYGASGMVEAQSETGREATAIDDAFEPSATWVMLVPEGRWAQEKALIQELESLPKVKGVTSYANTVSELIPPEMVPESQRSQLISKGYSRIIIQTVLDPNSKADYGMVEEVLRLGEAHYGDESHLAGAQVSEHDLKVTTQADSGRVRLFSLLAIAFVLMITFRSLSIPLIVLIPIEIAIWINMAVPYFAGQSLNYIGYLVIDAVQLGASVDYAIIFTREYLEQRRARPPLQAARAAVSRAAIMIITSALILTVAGLSIFFIASNTLISEIGMLVGRGAFISMLMMFTLLPLLFVLCDWIVRHTSLGAGFFEKKKQGDVTV
ncbi:MAG: MMPL family transporter [Coriobacteriales bacterium]|jgi:predicted RND superfamily exporter protein|nr:MMPL family transporter [Coriobacteriales bacterium]